MILAAGKGERMRPLTLARAKPALPVLGRPLLGRILAGLVEQGVRSFAVNAFHRPESVRATLEQEAPEGVDVEFFVESDLMGSSGALAAPREFLSRSPWFVLHNGDTLVDAPLAALADKAAQRERSIGALLVRPERTPGYGGVVLAGDLVTGRFEPDELAPADGLASFLGVSVLRSELLDRIPQGRPSNLFPELVTPLLGQGWSLAALPYDGPWQEFTTPAQYHRNIVRLLRAARADGEIPLPGGPALVQRVGEATVFVAEDAEVDRGVMIAGALALERGARVAPGARLANVILLEDAIVDRGAALTQVIVDQGARARRDAEYQNGVLTRGPGGSSAFHPF